MDDRKKTKAQLIAELKILRKRIATSEINKTDVDQVVENPNAKNPFIETLINICPDILYL